jgi:hypothetical protein
VLLSQYSQSHSLIPPLDPKAQASEYSAKYTRPQTTTAFGGVGRLDTGYASNNHVSPLELAARPDRHDYQETSSHDTHCPTSSVVGLLNPKPMVRAAMEKSGYWREPEPNVLYESPATRTLTAQQRTASAANLDPITLKRMTKKNPIDGENGGAGPVWGSTTAGQSYVQHESNHDRYWRTDRSLIGKREPDAFTRQHLTIPLAPVDPQASIMRTSYTKPPLARDLQIPNRVVMEKSGFTYSSIPTQNKKRPLSDVEPQDLPSLTVNRMKHVNTPEFQNLYDPDPFHTTYQISYTNPVSTVSRALTASAAVRRAGTGYNSNETVRAGPPGDPRWAKTGRTEFMKQYVDPIPALRARGLNACPNVVERSGYWSQ